MQVIVKPAAEKQLNRIPTKFARKVSEVIVSLKDNPFPVNSVKLKGEIDTYRIRVGDYRVVYFVDQSSRVVLVTRVRHRKDVYR